MPHLVTATPAPRRHPTYQHHHTPIQDATVVVEATVGAEQRVLQAVAPGKQEWAPAEPQAVRTSGKAKSRPTPPSPGRHLGTWPRPAPHSGQLAPICPHILLPMYHQRGARPCQALRNTQRPDAPRCRWAGARHRQELATRGRSPPGWEPTSLRRCLWLPPHSLAKEW